MPALVMIASALLSACVSTDGTSPDLNLLTNAAVRSGNTEPVAAIHATGEPVLQGRVTPNGGPRGRDGEVHNTVLDSAVSINAFENRTRNASPGPQLYSLGHSKPRRRIVDLSGAARTVDLSHGAAASGPLSFAPISGASAPPKPGSRSVFSADGSKTPEKDPIKVASAAGLARLAPNGLRRQHDGVYTACLKPRLLWLLAAVRHRFGRDVVITSGYRSPEHNRRVGGVSASRHLSCEAADIQVAGVSKWQLAEFLRSLPGRGGVGTYCHTKSVHIDIGRKRDWNWGCNRR